MHPALGGGHSRHHYQTMAAQQRSIRNANDPVAVASSNGIASDSNSAGGGHHEVCIDVVSRAVHCYVCDDYVLSDAPWLSLLRSDMIDMETKELPGETVDDGENNDTDLDMPDADSTTAASSVDDIASSAASIGSSVMDMSITNHQLPPMHVPPSPVPVRRSPRHGPLTPPGCAGLRNLGNTCYMNSVLQALSHCTGFRSFFNDFLRAAAPLRLGESTGPKVRLDRQTTAKHLLRLQDSEEEPDRLALTEAIHALLRVLWSGRWQVISPKAFVHAVWTHGGLFAARRQQDASEFLGFVLDRLDEELSPLNKQKDADTKKCKWPGTVLTDLFGIEQRQEVTCDACGTLTVRTEPLLGLYLSLPPSVGRRRYVTLQECLDHNTASERLTGDNIFECDKCNGKRNATKTVQLGRRPQTLLLSFRRTLWNKSKGLHKDGRRVDFPLNFNATALLSGHDGGEKDDNCHYRLAAIVSHSGSSPLCGHYISWCRVTSWSNVASVADLTQSVSDGGQWYLFNDSSVTPAQERDVLNAEAFILLYERMRNPVSGTT